MGAAGHNGAVCAMMRRFGEERGREKKQNCKRQKGRNGGGQTHLDFGGADARAISILKTLVVLRK